MKKCDSYHLRPTIRYTYHPLTGQPIAHDVEVGVCWGTKECDECSCGGDRAKCDFYPEVREKAKKELENVVTNADRIRAMAPTDKQIDFAEEIADVLGIDFPISSKDFTKQTYCEFIKEHYDEYRQVVEDANDLNFEDELAWFQMLNG